MIRPQNEILWQVLYFQFAWPPDKSRLRTQPRSSQRGLPASPCSQHRPAATTWTPAVCPLGLAPRCSVKVGLWASISPVIVAIPGCSLPFIISRLPCTWELRNPTPRPFPQLGLPQVRPASTGSPGEVDRPLQACDSLILVFPSRFLRKG